ncbi:MAG: 2-oxoacid:acceptor oxidoreductase subunit alpha [Patescibacteria group bacterium]|nr:2-oxoacid:acceptor oxidoreductase subunit alpha [Patescibacteria group bacterium]
MKEDYSILIGGAAGQGSRRAGFIIARLLSHYGYETFIYDDYQSLIRGGHNFSKIRAASEKVLSHRKKIDFLLAFNEETVEKHKQNLDKNGLIIYDKDKFEVKDKKAVGIATKEIIDQTKGKPIMSNTAFVAGFAKNIGINWQTLKNLLKEEFEKYEAMNLKIAKLAFEKADQQTQIEKIGQKKDQPLLTGNQALSLGAVKAGLDFYIAYPMTPSTGILHYLAQRKHDFNIGVAQLENEIGVISSAIGAAYTGARTMIGTSGGGFALMTESFSLAAMNETPLVIVESQRMSPASGVPTYNAQADLLFTANSGHGDILRFIIAPGDADEACFWGGQILNLSWQFQTPSILLIDKEISESTFTFDKKVLDKIKKEKPKLWSKKGKYLRYKETKDGISPLAFPGEKNQVIKANSYEHQENGLTTEEPGPIKDMQNKRLRKFEAMKKEVNKLPAVKVYGDKKAKKALIAWGSTKGPALEAAEKLGLKLIQPIILQPFPEKQMKQALKGVQKVYLAETNATAQLGRILKGYNIKVDKQILKYDARPFIAEEIINKVK